VFGQGWIKILPNLTIDAIPVSSGGYVYTPVIGWDNSQINKVDENGELLWQLPLSGGPVYSISETFDQGILMCAVLRSAIELIKTDEDGNIIWSNYYYGNEYSNPIYSVQLSDGSFILITINGSEDDHIFRYSKLDNNGAVIFTYETPNCNGGSDVLSRHTACKTNDEGVIIAACGEWNPNTNMNTAKLVKIDNNGMEEWVETFDLGYPTAVIQTSDLGYLFTTVLSYGNFLTKIDSDGELQWSNHILFVLGSGETRDDLFITDIRQTNDGGLVLCGFVHDGIFEEQLVVIKTDDVGNELWNFVYDGDTEEEIAFGIHQNDAGDFIVTGWTEDPDSGEYSGLLIKLGSEGTLSSSFTFPTPSNRKLEKVVDVLGREVNHTTNQILLHIYDDGSVEKKFVVD